MSENLENIKKQDVAEGEPSPARAQAQQRERAMLPAVDIFEEDDVLRLLADIPGVSKDSLRVEVDNNVLTVEGDISLNMPEGIAATYAEVRGSRYRRRFTLGHEIDAESIRAEVNGGVLNLVLPKKETHRRRRIEIQTA